MRSFTVLYGLLLSLSLQAQSTTNITPESLVKLGAVECRSETTCRQQCAALKTGPSLCTVTRQPYQDANETGVTRQSFCSDWNTICETEEIYIDRGTPNPAYNWELRKVKDRCWMKDSGLTPELRASCAPVADAIHVNRFPDCEIAEVTVDSDSYLKPVACNGVCETLKLEKAVSCSTEGSHSGAPPKAWGSFYVGKTQVCLELRRASGSDGQFCYELTPKPRIVRD